MNERQDAFWGFMTYLTLILLAVQGLSAFLIGILGGSKK